MTQPFFVGYSCSTGGCHPSGMVIPRRSASSSSSIVINWEKVSPRRFFNISSPKYCVRGEMATDTAFFLSPLFFAFAIKFNCELMLNVNNNCLPLRNDCLKLTTIVAYTKYATCKTFANTSTIHFMANKLGISIDYIKGEKWEPVKNYENKYMVSSLGRVKCRNHILRAQLNQPGYYRVVLRKNKYSKQFLVSRLVAAAFIPNPENKPHVNHIDCNPKNNRVENLEWCTHKENMAYASKLGRMKTPKNYVPKSSVPVIDTKTGITYQSITKAAKAFNKSVTHLSASLHGRSPNYTTMRLLNDNA